MTELASTIALVIPLVALATAVVTFMAKLRKQITEIHLLVNEKMDKAIARIEQLTAALTTAGVAVPQSEVSVVSEDG